MPLLRRRHLPVLALGLAASASAQSIPVRRIGPILATSTEDIGPGATVRGTSDGHVIVSASARQRVYAFDSTFTKFTLVVDSGSGTGTVRVRMTGLVPYLGDSTLLPDLGANVLLVLDPLGRQARSIAPPRPQDIGDLARPTASSRPGLDPSGRLIYRVNTPPPKPPANASGKLWPISGDLAAIVRGDFDTRRVDTVAWLKAPTEGQFAVENRPNPSGGPPTQTWHLVVNPFNAPDGWALLSDGTIAIVRVQDYHVDWIDPDGSRRSSPKMPFDWRRFGDAERKQIADSVRRATEDQLRLNLSSRGPSAAPVKLDVGVVSDSTFPDYWPPIQPGALLADVDGHLWILPSTSNQSANGLTYDVVSRKGEVIERVRVPVGQAVVGFGPNGVVYLAKSQGNATYLERAFLPPAR